MNKSINSTFSSKVDNIVKNNSRGFSLSLLVVVLVAVIFAIIIAVLLITKNKKTNKILVIDQDSTKNINIISLEQKVEALEKEKSEFAAREEQIVRIADSLKKNNKDLDEMIKKSEENKTRMKNEISRMTRELDKQIFLTDEKNNRYETLTITHIRLKGETEEYKDKIIDLQTKLSEQDKEREELKEQIEILNQRLDGYTNRLNCYDMLESTLQTTQEANSRLQDQVHLLEYATETLQEEANALRSKTEDLSRQNDDLKQVSQNLRDVNHKVVERLRSLSN